MTRKMKCFKKWLGLLLSILLLMESSDISVFAEEIQGIAGGEVPVSVESGQENISTESISTESISTESISTESNSADNIATGTYYGMDWVIDTNGHLTISGTYSGSFAEGDVSWKSSTDGTADDIITAKVTATGVTSTKQWFRGCTNLKSVDFTEFDTSNLTEMYWMFIDCSSLETVDLSNFDTSQVKDLSYLFSECTSLTSVNLSSFDTANVKNMSCMFQGCSSLAELDLSSFDTSAVTKMDYMFYGCSSLTELDLSNFNTSNVSTMDWMFQNCNLLETLNIGNFNTANVTTMSQMFCDCQALSSLELSHFDTSKVTKMTNMFMNCKNLAFLNLSSFDMSNVTSASGMFSLCKNLTELYAPKNVTLDIPLEISLADDTLIIYNSLPKEQTTSLHLKDMYAYGDYGGIEWYLSSKGELIITGTYGKGFGTTLWDDYKSEIKSVVADVKDVTDTSYWFQDCENLETVDLSQMDTSNITSMRGMFQNCSCLREVDISGWDTSQVNDMRWMFSGCSSLQTLDLSSFNTQKVINMGYMFDGCETLKSLDVSQFKTSALANIDYMFYGCKSLTELRFDNWNTTNITLATDMLTGCTGLKEVYCLKNLSEGTNIALPCELFDESGNVYTSMPVGEQESVLLTTPLEMGVYCGMNWMITHAGKLVVYGAYGAATETDVFWINATNADKISSAKVTATGVTSTFKWFYGLTNLESVDLSGFDSSKVTNMYYMFRGCSLLVDLDLSSFSTESVTNMEAMFQGCSKLSTLDLSNFNTAKVTNMASLFNGCSSLTQLDLSTFHTELVTKMSHMFYNCSKLEEIKLNVSHFQTAKVISMKQMFYNCKALKNIDVSMFNTEAVTDMYGMFYECNTLMQLDVSGFDTTNVQTMAYMFYNCKSLTNLDVSGFNTTNVQTMANMFNTCSSLTVLDVSKFNTANVTDMDHMFFRCSGVTNLDVSGFRTELVTNMNNMFDRCGAVAVLNMSSFDMINVTEAASLLNGCIALEGINTPKNLTLDVVLPFAMIDDSMKEYIALPKNFTESVAIRAPKTIGSGVYRGMNWNLKETGLLTISGTYVLDISNQGNTWSEEYAEDITKVVVTASDVESCFGWFNGLTNLKTVDFSKFDTSKVIDMQSMFTGCSSLTELDLSTIDTSNVISMSGMFKDCSSLEKLNISGFNTAKVYNMSGMFEGCSSLTQLDVRNFDVAGVKFFASMFEGCSSLTNLDLSNFKTTKQASTMISMFEGCTGLSELDLSSFDTSEIDNICDMFKNCVNIRVVNMSSFDLTNISSPESVNGLLTGCNSLEQIYTPKNLMFDVELPTILNGIYGQECSVLPKYLSESVLYKKAAIVASGTYCGMSWTINEYGGLNIFGTYGEAQETDTTWINNMEYVSTIASVKVTATGVKSTSLWFKNMIYLKVLDLSAFDTSQVTDMSGMFDNCISLTTLDLSNFDTSNVTNMGQMFIRCSSLETLDVSSFQTNNVKVMGGMFSGCKKLSTLDISNFSTSKIQGMDCMFYECASLTELDLSGLDARQITAVEEMFYGCSSLQQINTPINLKADVDLPLSMVDADGIYNALPKNETDSRFLKRAVALGTYSGMDWAITKEGELFIAGTYGDTADTDTSWHDYSEIITSAKITTKNVTSTYRWFYNMDKLEQIDFSEFDTSKVTNMSGMFNGCSALKSLDLSNFDTSLVEDMSYLFYGCNHLTAIKWDADKFNTANVTTMRQMFYKCSALTAVDVSGFDTELVKDMYCMFYECKSLSKLEVSKFNTSNVTNMNRMFWYCSALTELDVSGFDTRNVTDMASMFNTCSGLTRLDVSNFNTAKVTDVNHMFYRCNQITLLDLGGFDMGAVTDASDMFAECTSLEQIQTPVNLTVDSVLPYIFADERGIAYEALPKDRKESIFVKKPFVAGIYYGMGWTINEDGLLVISGDYSVASGTDTIWTDYAQCIVSAKVIATGVKSTVSWFEGCSALKKIDFSSFDASKIINAEKMFAGCTGLSCINTPKNVNIEIVLPKELEDKERNVYTVLPKNLEESIVLTHVIYRIAAVEDQTYTGKALKPEVTVYKGDRVLTLGVDYTVSYKNNKNVADENDEKKPPTIIVKGKNNYMGTLTRTFTIKGKELTEENTTVLSTVVKKNGRQQSFKSTVTLDGKKLRPKKDYEIEYTNTQDGAYTNPGKYEVLIKGCGNYSGQVSAALIVLDEGQIPASKLKIGKIETCDYNEKVPATPTFSVSYNGKDLELGKDYAVAYKNNDRVGKATVIITGLENVATDGTYVTGSVTKTFVVNGVSLKKASVKAENKWIYTGEEICPAVTVTLNNVPLRPDIDYTVEYTKNINVGKGSITIRGCGGYTGTIKKSFNIVVDEAITDRLNITFEGGVAKSYYCKSGAKPQVYVRVGDVKLEFGKDYIVSYKNNKKIAEATDNSAPSVTIKGKGNYKFTKTVPFTIEACPVEKLNVTVTDKFLGDKKGYLSVPILKDGNKKLTKDKDYTVSYQKEDGSVFDGTGEITNDMTVTVVIQGQGNYAGKINKTYRIATIPLSKVKITAKPLEYNEGNPVIYIGENIKDGLLVLEYKAKGDVLQYGEDYRIIGYKNNTKTGTATVTIVGCGEYGGERTVKFKIVKYPLQ